MSVETKEEKAKDLFIGLVVMVMFTLLAFFLRYLIGSYGGKPLLLNCGKFVEIIREN